MGEAEGPGEVQVIATLHMNHAVVVAPDADPGSINGEIQKRSAELWRGHEGWR